MIILQGSLAFLHVLWWSVDSFGDYPFKMFAQKFVYKCTANSRGRQSVSLSCREGRFVPEADMTSPSGQTWGRFASSPLENWNFSYTQSAWAGTQTHCVRSIQQGCPAWPHRIWGRGTDANRKHKLCCEEWSSLSLTQGSPGLWQHPWGWQATLLACEQETSPALPSSWHSITHSKVMCSLRGEGG